MKKLHGIFRGVWGIQGEQRGICALLSAIEHNYLVICENYDCGSCVVPVYIELQKLSLEQ